MRWVLGILISILLLVWAFHGVDFHPLMQTFAVMPLWPVLMMLIGLVLYFVIKALRWSFLLSPIGNYSTLSLLPAALIGNAVNFLFFGYVGEFVRAWLLSKEYSVKKGPVLMTIAMERIFDLWTLLLLLGLATYISPALPPVIAKGGYIGAGLGLFATILASLMVFCPKLMLKGIRRVIPIFPVRWHGPILEEIEWLTKGLSSIAHPQLLLGLIVTSVLQWTLLCLISWFATSAVGVVVPPWALLGPLFLAAIGVVLPSSPGQIGVIEISFVLGLSVWGVAREKALAAGLLYHAVVYISVIAVAFVIAKRKGLSWDALFSLFKKEKM